MTASPTMSNGALTADASATTTTAIGQAQQAVALRESIKIYAT
jgi:hypothetical protein